MASHVMTLPWSLMIWASSSRDHLLCFFAGHSDVCGGVGVPTDTSRPPSNAVILSFKSSICCTAMSIACPFFNCLSLPA